jgi:hypothetical protein
MHPAGTSCGAVSCTGRVETAAGMCNGLGACTPGAPRACAGNEICHNDRCTVNVTPVVNAGANQTKLTVGGALMLSGSATDDGLPVPAALTYAWTMVSGPANPSFSAPNAAATSVTFSTAGVYVLRLSASDGMATGQGDVTITVLGLDVGLAGHWKFDEGSGTQAADGSGGNNHAALTFGTGWTASGRHGKALDPSGDADYGTVSDPANGRLDFGTGDFTISVWVQTTGLPAMDTYPQVLNKWEFVGNGRYGYEVMMWTWNGEHATTFKIWSAPNDVSVNVKGLNDGQWHHVVGRKTATKTELFADGILRETATHAFGTLSGNGPLVIGGFAGQAWADYDGKLDDLRLYGRALSNAEITALAGGAAP